jgi:hypothetical protein
MAGNTNTKNGNVHVKTTSRVPSYCRLREITSCNEKDISRGQLWCYMKMRFTNCPDQVMSTTNCEGTFASNVGKCQTEKVDGDIQAITMYESTHFGKNKHMPSGFSLKFSRSGETGYFGSTGDQPTKAIRWTNINVVGRRA